MPSWSSFPLPMLQNSPGNTSTLGSPKRLKVRITCYYLPLRPSPPAFPSSPWFPFPPSSPCFPCCSDRTSVSDGQSLLTGWASWHISTLMDSQWFRSDAQGFQPQRLSFVHSPGTRKADTNVQRNS